MSARRLLDDAQSSHSTFRSDERLGSARQGIDDAASTGTFCPFTVIEGVTRASVSCPHLNALWTSFDNPECGLGSRERHVVGHYRLGEALEGKRANLFGYNTSL